MNRTTRWLLRRLLRQNPRLATDITVTDVLTEARVTARITRDQVADRTGVTSERVLALELGLIDPRLSEIRRYAHAIGALSQFRVITPTEGENP
ncbi:helix-turn-helix domain-containing protein [Nocardia asiatica]|uniref:helix-turn-helix domain-containing protein n=1 Tax=Nocardia asiatica TaxID=209252 RepID=UPI002454EC7F|nr:helix-turn-helix transcriptional regulator [Nocardia asiatica]